jgi:hypothetical protein
MVRTIEKLKWVNTTIPISLYKDFQKKVESDGFSIIDVVRLFIIKYVNGDFDIK